MAVHPLVRSVAEAFLREVDEELPGLVEGLYLTGSVALGDFRPHTSDINFVVVTTERLTPAQHSAVRRVHARLRSSFSRPHFNGIYVTWDDLATDPQQCGPVASVLGGRFRFRASAEVNPVTWRVLAGHGVAIRGPLPDDVDIWDEPSMLRTWSLGSLEEHWRRWRAKAGHLITPRGLAVLGSLVPSWSVLSVTRLHFTLRTGEVTSKSGAGFYALHAFPERWERIVNECLRIRRNATLPSLYRNVLERRRAALDYIEMVVDDALSLHPA